MPTAADHVPDPSPPFAPPEAYELVWLCDSKAGYEREYGDAGWAEFWRAEAEDFRVNPPRRTAA